MNRQKGFTIIELLVATMVFSVILLILMAALLQIGRIYYKGVTNSKTQEVARTVIEDVSKVIQFSGGDIAFDVNGGSSPKAVCIGSRRYTYDFNKQVKGDTPPRALIADNSGSGSCLIQTSGGSELMAEGMRLVDFSVTQDGSRTSLYHVKVKVAYGDDDLLCSPSQSGDCDSNGTSPHLGNKDLTCKSSRAGTQFCSTSELSTTVQKRL